MVSREIKDYLSTRYSRLLEYSNYHAGLAKLDQQGGDVLNEVLLNLLSKDPDQLQQLYKKKSKGYRELDYYILRMIKLNCHSSTSPYRFKYKVPKRDENADIPGLDDEQELRGPLDENEIPDIEDEPYCEFDRSGLICARFNIIRDTLESLPVPEREKEIFRYKFFCEESWGTWKGREKTKQLQTVYKKVKALVIYKIERLKCSYAGHIAKSTYQMERVKSEYSKTLIPSAFRYSQRYLQAVKNKEKYELLLNQINGNHEYK